MSIHLRCTTCDQPIRVADNLGGKRVKCPKCNTIVSVPAAAVEVEAEEVVTEDGSVRGLQSVASDDVWHFRTAKGKLYGPLSRKMVDYWLAHGRIDAHCLVRSPTSEKWMPATEVFSQLSPPHSRDCQELLAQVSAQMDKTTPWVRHLAIASSVIAGIYLLWAAFSTLLNSFIISKGGHANTQLLGSGIVCLITGCLVACIARCTFVCNQKTVEFAEEFTTDRLRRCVASLNSYWTFVSILSILFAVFLSLVSIVAVLGLVIPFINAIRHGRV
jgi:phage FluMu protein Com